MRGRKLPLSGSEPLYSDLIYGTPRGKENNNCYAWALDAYRDSGGIKLQPGDLSGETSDRDSASCKFLVDRAMDDNRTRGIRSVPAAQRCPQGFYKIMAFIDKGRDYHWYKHHNNVLYRVRDGETLRTIARDLGVPMRDIVSPTPAPRPGDLVYVKRAGVFSHKQGFATGPLLRDAAGATIPDPRAANRNYGEYNYRTFCGAMCVRNVHPVQAQAVRATKRERSILQTLLAKRMAMPDMTRPARSSRKVTTPS